MERAASIETLVLGTWRLRKLTTEQVMEAWHVNVQRETKVVSEPVFW